MAFLEALPELFGALQGIEGTTLPLFQQIYQGSLQNEQMQNNNMMQFNLFGQQRAMQDASNKQALTLQQNAFQQQNSVLNLGHANSTEMQQTQFNNQNSLANSLYAHQTQMQQASFANQSSLETARFDQQSNLQSTAFKNSLTSGAVSSAVNLGGNLIESGINYALSSKLLDQQAALQRQNFDYTTGKAADAFQQAGLPTWLAYGGSANNFAHQTQQISGQNTFTSVLPGNSNALIWNGSSSQLALGVGNIPAAQ